jgi:hypothetical protein
MVLQGARTLSNTESCHFSTKDLQLYPGLRCEKEYTVRAPQLYAPSVPAITSAAELENLKKITKSTDADIDRLASIIQSHGDRTDLRRHDQATTDTPSYSC